MMFQVFELSFDVPPRDDAKDCYEVVEPWIDRWIETFLDAFNTSKALICSNHLRLKITVFNPYFDLIDGQMRWVEDQPDVANVRGEVVWI